MTNLKYLEIQSYARDYAKDSSKVKVLLSVAVAMIAGLSLSIPSNEADSPSEFYVNNLQEQVNSKFNEFNEQILICADTVQELARSIWMMRYRATYGTLVGSTVAVNDFVGMLFGSSTYIAKETLCFLNEHSAFLSSLSIRIKAVMDSTPNATLT